MASNCRPRMPQVRIRLDGEDRNAFVLVGKCQEAMLDAGAARGSTKSSCRRPSRATTTTCSAP
jgi:hypothetical protein